MTAGLQTAGWITSLENGSGGQESHLPQTVYETVLCALVEFPAKKWWSRWVTLPHKLACRASALLVCHDPKMKMAGCLRAARSELSFGDSAAC